MWKGDAVAEFQRRFQELCQVIPEIQPLFVYIFGLIIGSKRTSLLCI